MKQQNKIIIMLFLATLFFVVGLAMLMFMAFGYFQMSWSGIGIGFVFLVCCLLCLKIAIKIEN